MTSSAPPADPVRVAVFAKAPAPGSVKTRLIPLLGADGAARLHAALVRHALSIALESGIGPVELWCAPATDDPFFERCAREFGITLRAQAGADLGERMRHAIATSLDEGAARVIIGGDCPAMAAGDLQAAAAALRGNDVVLTPAEDGGYVLVGAARVVPGMFEGVAWGTPGVLEQTRVRLAAAGARWAELPTLWDVDRHEDYARLQQSDLLRAMLS